MSVLNHLAEAAAVILLLELIVVVVILAGISGGLAFGLRWVRGRTGWAFDQANTYLRMGARYLHTGTDFAAKPLIQTSAFADKIKGVAHAIQEQVRRTREAGGTPRPAPPVPRTAPNSEPIEETEAHVPII